MKLLQLTFLLITLFTLQGCGFKDVPDVDIEEAILYSPEGEFEFKRDKNNSFLFVAHDNTNTVRLSLFPLDGKTILKFHTKKVIIKSDEVYYQLNNGKKNKLIIKHNRNTHKYFDIISPVTMDYYKKDGDGLHVTRQRKKITSEHKNKVDDETYRYYIPFTIDNKSYAIDVTFQLEIDTTLRFGVPGMP